MEARVRFLEDMAFEAKTGTGHTLVMDAAPEVGGHNRGPRPMEMLLVGLGGCTGMDVVSILRKMRQPVTGYEVIVRGERAAEHPKVFTEIVVEHVVYGNGLAEEMVRRAVELSETRYCSASAMLSRAARVTHTYRIVEEASADDAGGDRS